MTPSEARRLIEDLEARGIVLGCNDERIVFDAPIGTLTDADRAQLIAGRPALLILLRRRRAGLDARLDPPAGPALDAALASLDALNVRIAQVLPASAADAHWADADAWAAAATLPAHWSDDARLVYVERLAIAESLGMSIYPGSPAEQIARSEGNVAHTAALLVNPRTDSPRSPPPVDTAESAPIDDIEE